MKIIKNICKNKSKIWDYDKKSDKIMRKLLSIL